MRLLKQADRNNKVSQCSQLVFEHVDFSNVMRSFTNFLDELARNGLIDEEWERRGSVWDDYRHRNGVMLETLINPMVYNNTPRLTVSGNRDALLRFTSILEKYASFDGAPRPEDIEITHQYHDTLNEMLWKQVGDTYELHGDVKKALKENADAFFEFLDVPKAKITDIVLTGSAANFNWTGNSDIDLHIIVDVKAAEKEYGKLFQEYVNAKKSLWNDLHSIVIKGFPVEFYVESASEGHVSTGVFSLKDNKWVIEPQHNEPSVDDSAVKAKAAHMIKEIQQALGSNKADVIEKMIEKIRKMRQSGLDDAGEFSTANLAYKILRNDKWLDKLYDCKTKAYDRDLSLEDEEWSCLL